MEENRFKRLFLWINHGNSEVFLLNQAAKKLPYCMSCTWAHRNISAVLQFQFRGARLSIWWHQNPIRSFITVIQRLVSLFSFDQYLPLLGCGDPDLRSWSCCLILEIELDISVLSLMFALGFLRKEKQQCVILQFLLDGHMTPVKGNYCVTRLNFHYVLLCSHAQIGQCVNESGRACCVVSGLQMGNSLHCVLIWKITSRLHI